MQTHTHTHRTTETRKPTFCHYADSQVRARFWMVCIFCILWQRPRETANPIILQLNGNWCNLFWLTTCIHPNYGHIRFVDVGWAMQYLAVHLLRTISFHFYSVIFFYFFQWTINYVNGQCGQYWPIHFFIHRNRALLHTNYVHLIAINMTQNQW